MSLYRTKALLDLLMPRVCLVCGRTLAVEENHLCGACRGDLPLTYYWEREHNLMADKFNSVIEEFRADDEYMPYSFAAALLFYHAENPYKRIPQAIKYRYNRRAGKDFGTMLGEKLSSAAHFADVDLVIPVPLHWTRLWKRGYNQAGVIAESAARAMGAKYAPDVLLRRRKTGSQVTRAAGERLSNAVSAFCPNPRKRPDGCRHILVVDDTFTTGATLAGCYLAIRDAFTGREMPRISVATLSVVEAV